MHRTRCTQPRVKAWDDLPETHQRLACRLQEAFAAFLDHTDDQIGRLVDALRNIGELDNTILVLLADNGASQEGGPFGVMHEMKYFNGIHETPETAVERIDDIGGPNSHTTTRGVGPSAATHHFGGTSRTPMRVVSMCR